MIKLTLLKQIFKTTKRLKYKENNKKINKKIIINYMLIN